MVCHTVEFILILFHIFCLNNNEDTSDYAIANVSCHYDSPRDDDSGSPRSMAAPALDHTYGARDEPPAFIIHSGTSLNQATGGAHPFVEVNPNMTFGPGGPVVNVIHVGDPHSQMHQPGLYNMSKRVRRSEDVLRQAAECVSRGSTFQTVSEQFNIPISTIRFFMARKGILPRRRRGRSAQISRSCSSPEPPFHMQHFKLPDMVAMKGDPDDTNNS